MLFAYLDEVGDSGAFISLDHARYNTNPVFGYAGFILRDDKVREFGARFVTEKRSLLSASRTLSTTTQVSEIKGSDMFRPTTHQRYPQNIRIFNGLAKRLSGLGGNFFYYADEKPLGTPRQVNLDVVAVEEKALRETLNRLCTYAEALNQNLVVIFDQITEKTRRERLSKMYAHVFSRSSDHPEMRRIIEPPMHMDSKLSANIQYADWVAAVVSKAANNQIIRNSPYHWIPEHFYIPLQGTITNESKIHLWQRDAKDLHNIDLFKRYRPLHGNPGGTRIADRDPKTAEKMERIRSASYNHRKKR